MTTSRRDLLKFGAFGGAALFAGLHLDDPVEQMEPHGRRASPSRRAQSPACCQKGEYYVRILLSATPIARAALSAWSSSLLWPAVPI